MIQQTKTCPDREKLTDFSLGKVTDDDLAAVASHVESCETCLAELTVVNATGDTLVALLRRGAEPSQFDDEAPLKHTLTRIREIGRDPSFSSITPARKQPELGTIRDYKLLALLGQGGMGAVYKALHTQLEKIVALKVLPAERMQPDAVARFRREMRAVGKLHHQNIVQAFDAGEHEGKHFLVMECVDGVDLHTLVCDHGPLNIADACEIVRQAAEGLQHAHQHGLVHRDIKPSNLMLTRAGQIKVLDMGLALLQESTNQGDELTATCQIMGTPDYVAPEQAGDSHSVDIRADIYSLGCTLFKLVTGNVPYPPPEFKTAVQKMAAHMSRPFPDIATKRSDIPKTLKKILNRMVAKQPGDRYATPGDVATALAPLAAGHKLVALARPVEESAKGDNAQTLATNPHFSALIDTISGAGVSPASRIGVPPVQTTSKLGRRSPVPPYILLAAAAAALIAAAVTIIKIQTRDGMLVLSVEGENAVVTIDGETAQVALDADGRTHRIYVDPGTHTLVVTTPDGVRYKSDNQFTMEAGGVARLTARLEKKHPASTPVVTSIAPPNFALDLWAEEGAPLPFVDLPSGFIPQEPCTVEITVRPRSIPGPPKNCGLWMTGRSLSLRQVGGRWQWMVLHSNTDGSEKHVNVSTKDAATPGLRTYLAGVSTGKELRLFVNGKFVGSTQFQALSRSTPRQVLGDMRRNAEERLTDLLKPFDGTIDEVRISTIARYSENYTPLARLETDNDTFALYHCDEGQGDVLVDSSGNKRDGKIVGPKWVREDAGSKAPLFAGPGKTQAPPTTPFLASSANRNFALDMSAAPGLGAFVTLPKGLVPEQPCTVEMMVCPRSITGPTESTGLWFINPQLRLKQNAGSWQWMGFQSKDFTSKIEQQWAFVNTKNSSITPGQRTYLAAVSAGKELRLFVDGKLIGSSAVALSAAEVDVHHLGNHANTPGWSAFDGTIDEVRISTVARYTENYAPLDRLEADQDTFALYHCDEGQGDVLVDSSGNNRHGKIVGAKWVSAEATGNIPQLAETKSREVSPGSKTELASADRGFALDLSANSNSDQVGVILPTGLPVDRPFSVEMVVVPRSIAQRTESRGLWSIGNNLGLKQYSSRWNYRAYVINQSEKGNPPDLVAIESAEGSIKSGQLVHLAGVSTGQAIRFFVDGKLVGSRPLTRLSDANPHHILGNIRRPGDTRPIGWNPFEGTIDEVRISTIARYSENYTPLERLETDQDTFALYHCDEGQGDVLLDSSGQNRHGKIVGAKWVRAEAASVTPLTVKDGKTPDRAVAEWALGIGGWVKVRMNGQTVEVHSTNELPTQELQVTNLYLANCPVRNDDLARFAGLSRLEMLDLTSTQVSDATLKHLENLTSLQYLYLGFRPITDTAFDSLVKLKNLRRLNLNRTKLTATSFARLKELPQLEQLDLFGLPFGDADAANLVTAQPNLRILNLTSTKITDAGLAQLAKLQLLNDLYIDGTAVSNAGLAHLAQLPQLRILTLTNTAITDQGTRHLARMPAIERLSLPEGFSDLGIEQLSGLAKLESLNLRGNAITDASAAHFARMPRVQTLSISDTAITDAGIEKLAQAHPLTHLVIASPQISPAAIARLHKLLPKVKLIDWRPANPDTLAAKQVVEWGGKVTIAVEDSQRVIAAPEPLPSAAFSVVAIDLSGPRPAVEEDALEILRHLKQLRTIDLRQVAVTDAGLEHLKKAAPLTNIDLRDTKVTTAGVQSLQASLPKCKIEASP